MAEEAPRRFGETFTEFEVSTTDTFTLHVSTCPASATVDGDDNVDTTETSAQMIEYTHSRIPNQEGLCSQKDEHLISVDEDNMEFGNDTQGENHDPVAFMSDNVEEPPLDLPGSFREDECIPTCPPSSSWLVETDVIAPEIFTTECSYHDSSSDGEYQSILEKDSNIPDKVDLPSTCVHNVDTSQMCSATDNKQKR